MPAPTFIWPRLEPPTAGLRKPFHERRVTMLLGADGIFVPGLIEGAAIKAIEGRSQSALERDGLAGSATGEGINKVGSPSPEFGTNHFPGDLEPCVRVGEEVSRNGRFTGRHPGWHGLLRVAGSLHQIAHQGRPGMPPSRQSQALPTTHLIVMNSHQKLFTPVKIGPIQLSHRIVMPALSRTRSEQREIFPALSCSILHANE